jgi:predicted transposase/invertase (TIGR01784 family)
MAQTETSSPRKKALTAKDLGVYISLLTDFGFKRVFGVKEMMIKFLNTVLDIEGGITDLHYGNPEKPGLSKYNRKAVYDLYCTTGKDEHIIVEVQSTTQVYFKDRTLTYVARHISEQYVKKGKDWNYELPKIYSVNILDFTFEAAAKLLGVELIRTDQNKYVSKVQLIDCDTKELFYDKLTFVFIELPRFTKELKDLKTFFEKWIFILKHIQELDDLPKKFRNDKIFEQLFEIAKIALMTQEEVNNYLKDLNDMNIVKNEIGTRDRIIAQHVNTITQRDNTIAQHVNTLAQRDSALAQRDSALQKANAEIAEYQRRYGVLPT